MFLASSFSDSSHSYTHMERIDTHCHIVPPGWRRYCQTYGHGNPDGNPGIPEWTAKSHIAMMDKLSITKSILSITSPGTHLVPGNDVLARCITRETNQYVAKVCADHPDRFGFFASLPLPDVKGSLAEIDYALDHLGAAGFAVLTNAHGIYLGDAALEPVFAKLNERKAILFMHPTSCCGADPASARPLVKFPAPLLEFFFDTTRAVTNLILSGTVERHGDIKFLVSHCGATLPPVVQRISNFSFLLDEPCKLNSSQIKELFKTRFWFDLAGFPFPDLIHGFLRISDQSRLLYGSDYPFTPEAFVQRQGAMMEEGLSKLFDVDTIRGIYSGHARNLIGD